MLIQLKKNFKTTFCICDAKFKNVEKVPLNFTVSKLTHNYFD